MAIDDPKAHHGPHFPPLSRRFLSGDPDRGERPSAPLETTNANRSGGVATLSRQITVRGSRPLDRFL